MSDFANKVYVVTGGGSGIGVAISRMLCDAGAKVVVGQRSSSTIGPAPQ